MASAAPVTAGVYDLDRTHSTVQFSVRHVGVSTFRGSFQDVDARLTLAGDEVQLQAQALVESISITEPDFREHVVRGEDFFAAGRAPVITFRSTEVLLGDGRAELAGELTIRGVSRLVRAQGQFTPPREDPFGGTRLGLELATSIDRRHFGMDWQMALPGGGDALGWEIRVTAQLEFVRRA